jgi:hypothetical protein
MTKAQWDELSNKDKYDLYSGYKPKKEKEQGRFAGGKETPAKKATSPAAARSKAMAARKAETAKKRGTGSRTGALASARKAGRKKAASKYDQSVHQVGATKSKSKHTKKSAPTSSSRFPKGGGRRSARAGSRFTSDY